MKTSNVSRYGSKKMLVKALSRASLIDIFELELFEWYARETDKLLEEMLSEEVAYIKQQYDSGCDSDRVNDSGVMAAEYYVKRIRFSHVIYLTSLLEAFLKLSCDRLGRALEPQGLLFTLSEIKGDQWESKRKFLERYGRFSIPGCIWQEIHVLISIRNNLVHDNGDTGKLSDKLKAKIDSRAGLNISGDEITINKEYVDSAFNSIKDLFKYIDQQIEVIVEKSCDSSNI